MSLSCISTVNLNLRGSILFPRPTVFVYPHLRSFPKKPALSLITLLSVANARQYKFAVNVAGCPQDFTGIKILSKWIKVQT